LVLPPPVPSFFLSSCALRMMIAVCLRCWVWLQVMLFWAVYGAGCGCRCSQYHLVLVEDAGARWSPPMVLVGARWWHSCLVLGSCLALVGAPRTTNPSLRGYSSATLYNLLLFAGRVFQAAQFKADTPSTTSGASSTIG
jgi:hypothetical protein